ncbi:hypothetical protein C2S51_037159, partial [Perilla frutescens var. frutescens]
MLTRALKKAHQWRNDLKWKSVGKEVVSHCILFAQFLSLQHLSTTYIFHNLRAFGESMMPTLNPNGDVVVIESVSLLLGKVGAGDVIVARSPEDPRSRICKRILGVEGDTVTFFDHRTHQSKSIVIPEGHVWIQGDNTCRSHDSRCHGPIPYGLIIGKVFCR